MKRIDKSIVKLIDEDLMSFIVVDTRKLVSKRYKKMEWTTFL